jgi:large subunit ribosomal protein L29
MNVKELRALNDAELVAQYNALKDELFNLRFQQATGQLSNTARLKTVKKEIARIKTLQSERAAANND